jgi:carbon monoxide dehydrogenase subunit G
VTVKIGPATMSFRGEVEVRDIDPGQRSLALLAKGTDSTGTSGASMDLKARVESAGEASSNLVGHSEVSMSGKAAAFGGRMMNSVADQLMQQFAANFAAQVSALHASRAVAGTPAAGTAGEASDATTAAYAGAGDAAVVMPPIVPPVANELDGLALAWAVFKDWLRGLFTRKSA